MDFAYLESFTAGDRQVLDEVLVLFVQQAEGWAMALRAPEPGWRDLAHTIKGSARGVGANALGDACARAEEEGEGALAQVCAALAAAVAEIEAYRTRA